MSPTSSQQWTRRIRYSDQHLRVSDAERNAVVERLSTHFSEGRLDQAEFDERVSQAMAAKTRGDLAGMNWRAPLLAGMVEFHRHLRRPDPGNTPGADVENSLRASSAPPAR